MISRKRSRVVFAPGIERPSRCGRTDSQLALGFIRWLKKKSFIESPCASIEVLFQWVTLYFYWGFVRPSNLSRTLMHHESCPFSTSTDIWNDVQNVWSITNTSITKPTALSRVSSKTYCHTYILRQTDWLADWLTDIQTSWLIDKLTDWLIYRLHDTHSQTA